jgi:hypothetical protein
VKEQQGYFAKHRGGLKLDLALGSILIWLCGVEGIPMFFLALLNPQTF